MSDHDPGSGDHDERNTHLGTVVRIPGCVAAAVAVSSDLAVPFHSDRWIALLSCIRPGKARPRTMRRAKELPNKRMQLTKLSAAWLPEWTCRLMPAPARSDAGTASQLIRRVGRTSG
jgi:hypothetical protein